MAWSLNRTPIAKESQVEISLEWQDCQLNCDRDRVIQVLINLLSNAIKFSPPQSMVKLIYKQTRDHNIFEVIDEGLPCILTAFDPKAHNCARALW